MPDVPGQEEVVCMLIRKIKLVNFRSWKRIDLEFVPEINIIWGLNASGKTNILEAVAIISLGKNLRGEYESEIIRQGKDASVVEAKVERDGQIIRLGYSIGKTEQSRVSKRFLVNGVGRTRSMFAGNLAVVYFGPEELELVVGPPGQRRRFLDTTLSIASREYAKNLLEYNKVVRVRNKLLFRVREGLSKINELDYWNLRMLELGEQIGKEREGFFLFINNFDNPSKKVTWDYRRSVLSGQKMKDNLGREIAAAVSLSGPHRDDFKFFDGVRNLASYGSRGEQRMAVLALKTAEIDYLSKVFGSKPVLLLDDIFSELDHVNRSRVLELIKNQQSIITSTESHNELTGLKNVKEFRTKDLIGG